VALSVLGAINQAIRQPPLVVDLTLQCGNGGFVVLGVLLASAGALFHRPCRSARLRLAILVGEPSPRDKRYCHETIS